VGKKSNSECPPGKPTSSQRGRWERGGNHPVAPLCKGGRWGDSNRLFQLSPFQIVIPRSASLLAPVRDPLLLIVLGSMGRGDLLPYKGRRLNTGPMGSDFCFFIAEAEPLRDEKKKSNSECPPAKPTSSQGGRWERGGNISQSLGLISS